MAGKRSSLRAQALGISQKAFERLMADEQRAQWVAQVVGHVQRGKKALDCGQEELMRALQLAVRSDFGEGRQAALLAQAADARAGGAAGPAAEARAP